MIASLTGTAAYVGLDRIEVRVGAVGLVLHTTPATAGATRVGAEVSLATSLVVREDSLTLFGFATSAEREMFQTLQSVTGVGPRLALAMLSVMGPSELRAALSSGDAKSLTKIPGIGAKSADRLVLELGDKVARMPALTMPAGSVAAPLRGDDWRDPVTEALIGLGWNAKQAGDAVARVAAAHAGATPASDDPSGSAETAASPAGAPAAGDVAAYLRLALRELRR